MASSAAVAFSLLTAVLTFSLVGAEGYVGVNYGRIADNLPTPDKVVELLKAQRISRVKLFDTDSAVLTALADTNISVAVALPNELLKSAAAEQTTFADDWVKANIGSYYPSTKIEAIAIGNEVFVDPAHTTPFLVPAMKNIYSSLQKFNLSSIKVSSPLALSSLNVSYPPSAGAFQPDLMEAVIKPMLDFISQTESYLMVNAYPFFAYSANSKEISLDYALSNENPGVVDPGNGLTYHSLLDAQLDAIYAAVATAGQNNISLVVTETGWPSAGDENEVGAGQSNAATYNGNLVKRVLTGKGTPLKPEVPLGVYLFALFNENMKTGPTSERNYGLFYPNEQKVYDIHLTTTSVDDDQIIPGGNTVSKAVVVGQTWCVANGNAAMKDLQVALDYACGEGGADCRPIQQGSACYEPNTLMAHASYAFNSYYQKNRRRGGTCSFGGTAHVVTQSPRFNNCQYPTGY